MLLLLLQEPGLSTMWTLQSPEKDHLAVVPLLLTLLTLHLLLQVQQQQKKKNKKRRLQRRKIRQAGVLPTKTGLQRRLSLGQRRA